MKINLTVEITSAGIGLRPEADDELRSGLESNDTSAMMLNDLAACAIVAVHKRIESFDEAIEKMEKAGDNQEEVDKIMKEFSSAVDEAKELVKERGITREEYENKTSKPSILH